MASPFIISPNGSGEALNSSTTLLTIANAFSVIDAGDAILLALATDGTADVQTIVSSGLTFTRIAHGATTIGEDAYLSVWYAVFPGPQTGFSIAATWSPGFDDAVANWAIARGCYAAAPLDPDASLPGVETGAPPPAVTFNTTNADDLLFFFFSGDNGMWIIPPPQTVTPSPPWAYLTGAGNPGGGGVATLGTYTQSVSSPQSGITAANDIVLTDGAVFIVVAVTADAPAPGVPIDEACGANSLTSITAVWSQGSGATPTSYTLQWRQVGASSWNTITGIAGTSQAIAGLMSGTSYEWQVEAIGTGGNSGFSTSTICSTLSIAPAVAPPQSLQRWRGAVGINWNGLALVGDAFAGVIGLSDFDNYTEYGNVMRMLITSPPLRGAERHRMFVTRVEVDVQAGSGFANTPVGAPVMMLDYSKNGGMTFLGLQKWRTTGQVGKYRTRLRWLNLGQSRAWVFRLQCTDNTRRQIIGIYLDAYEGLG